MAETTSSIEEITFDDKRKPDPCSQPKEEERSNKIQKLVVVEDDSFNAVKNGENGDHEQSDGQIDNVSSSVAEGKDGGVVGDEGEEEEEDDSEDGEKSSRKVAEDRKGKGIMKDDKGKGKLVEEDDDDDDDEDSSDDGSELGSEESELSDDPLAEVDLDNILPSRTRRRTVHPGVYFATDLGNDDDDSSDSDA